MPIQRLIIVQPCYSLEDLPRSLDAESAADYHACWTALWHPEFLRAVPNLPEWKRSDSSSLDVRESLVIVPAASASHIDTTLRERIDVNENLVLESKSTRRGNATAIANLLQLTLPEFAEQPSPLASLEIHDEARTPVCVRSFYALGFAYQQLHVLTRKVHYTTNLDLILFQEQVSKAAVAYCDGLSDEAEKWLQSCFDQLSQERDRYFSQQANLIDLTLVARSTMGDSIVKQLRQTHPQNLLASAGMLNELATRNSNAFELLANRIKNKECSLAGGLEYEAPTHWLSQSAALRSLADGRAAYEQLGLPRPRVFARLSSGIQPHDAQILRISGYSYAILSAWMDGELPRSDQAKIRWQSADSTTIDALSAFVLEADSALSIISIAVELAKQFDYHQVPTLVLAHWPNATCEAFEDLRLAVERTAALGKWQLLDEYFESTGQAYSNTALPVSQFKLPLPSVREDYDNFCKQLSRFAKRLSLHDSVSSVVMLLQQLVRWIPRKPLSVEASSQLSSTVTLAKALDGLAAKQLGHFQSDVVKQAVTEPPASVSEQEMVSQLDTAAIQAVASIADFVSGQAPQTSQTRHATAISHGQTTLSNAVALHNVKHAYLVNPHSVPMRYFLRTGNTRLTCDDSTRVYADETSASSKKLMQSGLLGAIPEDAIGGNEVIVDVPATGVVQLDQNFGASLGSIVSRKSNLATSNVTFGNEYLDVQLDAESGNIRALLVNRKRGSRMSGQFSILDPARLLGLDEAKIDSRYAEAKKARIVLEHNSTTSAVISVRGIMTFQGKDLAEYHILYELWRGSRLLQIKPSLRWLVDKPNQDVWSGAPVWRTAWPSEAAILRSWQQSIPTKVATATFFAPNLVEVDDAEHKLYLMFDGAHLHRRRELRYMDTHLGDGANATILVGLDVPNPVQQWSHWVQPALIYGSNSPMTGGQTSASFCSTTQRGVSISFVNPELFFAGAPESPSEAEFASKNWEFDAYCLVQETLAKSSNCELQFFRDVKKAAKVNCFGKSDEQLDVIDGVVIAKLRSCESVWIGVNWA